jgi:hypothetical protein
MPHGADFIEKERAAVGDLEKAFLGRDGAGECAFHVSEEGRFEQVGRRGAGVNRDERTVATGGIQMDRLGDEFLASPAFALQQHGGAAGSNLRDEVENLEHGLALAHDVFKVVALLERALELNIFFFRFLPGHGSAHVGQQLFVVPWLLDEIRGAGLHGADGVLDRAVGSDHDDGLLRMRQPDFTEHVHAVFVGEREVEHDDVERALADLRQPFARRSGNHDGVAFELKQRFQRFADFRFVVDDQNSARAGRCRFRRVSARDSRHFRHGEFRHGWPSLPRENRG